MKLEKNVKFLTDVCKYGSWSLNSTGTGSFILFSAVRYEKSKLEWKKRSESVGEFVDRIANYARVSMQLNEQSRNFLHEKRRNYVSN